MSLWLLQATNDAVVVVGRCGCRGRASESTKKSGVQSGKMLLTVRIDHLLFIYFLNNYSELPNNFSISYIYIIFIAK